MKICNYLRVAAIGTAMVFSVHGFGQDCNKYLNQQTKIVKTGSMILKVVGKVADATFSTNFASLTNSANDKLSLLDNLQYQECLKLQTLKSEFSKENQEAKIQQTLAEMVKLVNESGVLPKDAVNQLVAKGILPAEQAKTTTPTAPQTTTPTTAQTPSLKAATADEVPVPVLPAPSGTWTTITFPCQVEAKSSIGVIRARGMESSMDAQIAKSVANVIALEELASKIEVTVKSTTQYFIERTETNLNEELSKRFTRKIDVLVDQTIRGYRNTCEEYQENNGKFRCFVALEINEDAVLKPVIEELKKDPELQNAIPDYDKFKAVFEQALSFYEKTGIN